MATYVMDQVFEQGGVQYRVSATSENFIIATRVGAPSETEDPNDIIKVLK